MAQYIYGLVCPLRDSIRYVGKTNNPRIRLRQHLSDAKRHKFQHHTARWLRVLLDAGLEPEMLVLAEVPNGQNWQTVERGIIALLRENGTALTNSTEGGDGLSFIDAAHRSEISQRMSAGRVKACTPSVREALSLRAKAQWAQPGFREHMQIAARDASTEADRQRRSSTLKTTWAADPSGMAARFQTPEIRNRRKAAAEARWADPVFRAKMAEIYAGRRDKLAAASNIRWAKHRAKQVEVKEGDSLVTIAQMD